MNYAVGYSCKNELSAEGTAKIFEALIEDSTVSDTTTFKSMANRLCALCEPSRAVPRTRTRTRAHGHTCRARAQTHEGAEAEGGV